MCAAHLCDPVPCVIWKADRWLPSALVLAANASPSIIVQKRRIHVWKPLQCMLGNSWHSDCCSATCRHVRAVFFLWGICATAYQQSTPGLGHSSAARCPLTIWRHNCQISPGATTIPHLILRIVSPLMDNAALFPRLNDEAYKLTQIVPRGTFFTTC